MTERRTSLIEKLFTEHGEPLVRFLTKRLKSRQDAEDIAQHAYERIQKLNDDSQLDNPKAFLFQVAANLAIDQLRREKLHHNYVQSETGRQLDVDGTTATQIDQHSPERLLVAEEELQVIYDAIASLPVKCRQAFLLHRARGLSYNEIADEMRISVSSVEKYILQALKHCRKAALNQEGNQSPL